MESALAVHATTAPPAKLKKLRKKDEAAKAIERPKTIWMSLRKPPLVSPKASVRPVEIMMITAIMRATGPWTESRIDCSGPSQGIPEPAARAGKDIPTQSAPRTNASARRRRFTTEAGRRFMTNFLKLRVGRGGRRWLGGNSRTRRGRGPERSAVNAGDGRDLK